LAIILEDIPEDVPCKSTPGFLGEQCQMRGGMDTQLARVRSAMQLHGALVHAQHGPIERYQVHL
jgi:hypothetical protein